MTFKFTLQETIQNVKCKIFAFWYTSFVNYKRSNVLNVLCMRSIINTQIVYKNALFYNWNEIMKSSNELKSDRSLDIKMPSYFIFTEIENHYASLHFGYKRPSFFYWRKLMIYLFMVKVVLQGNVSLYIFQGVCHITTHTTINI